LNVLNEAHPSTLSGRAEDRAGHGEPAEPLNVLNLWNGPIPMMNGRTLDGLERAQRWNYWNRWNRMSPITI
jgi:hypothetical protein